MRVCVTSDGIRPRGQEREPREGLPLCPRCLDPTQARSKKPRVSWHMPHSEGTPGPLQRPAGPEPPWGGDHTGLPLIFVTPQGSV